MAPDSSSSMCLSQAYVSVMCSCTHPARTTWVAASLQRTRLRAITLAHSLAAFTGRCSTVACSLIGASQPGLGGVGEPPHLIQYLGGLRQAALRDERYSVLRGVSGPAGGTLSERHIGRGHVRAGRSGHSSPL